VLRCQQTVGRQSGLIWKTLRLQSRGAGICELIVSLKARYPRNIEKYIKGFKAEELGTFLIRYLLPLSFRRVNDTTYRALQRLVFFISKATATDVTYEGIAEMDYQLELFLKWYYETFYGNRAKNLPVCKYTVHGLTHLTKNIRDWGSAAYFWQFAEVSSILSTN
jgi:hypothetical protein